MKPGFKAVALSLALFFAMMVAAVGLQHRMIQHWRQQPPKYRDSLYLPDSRYVQILAIGYDLCISDLLWLRMIQSFAAGWSRPENADQMKHYFDIITDLDPHFIEVYPFTIMSIGEESHRDDMVHDVVTKGILENPGRYRIPYEGSAYASQTMGNIELAKYYIRIALLDPEHADFIERWPAYYELKDGRFRVAYERYFTDFIHKAHAGNSQLYGILLQSLSRAINEWIKSEIIKAAKTWHEQHGNKEWPTVEQLDQAGAFKGLEFPDWQRIQVILSSLAEAPPSQEPLDDNAIAGLVRSALKTWDRLPPGPHDFQQPDLKGFIIWPHVEPEKERFVQTTYEAAQNTQYLLGAVNGVVQEYKKEHDGQCPSSLESVAAGYLNPPPALPGNVVLDPQTCHVYLSTFPDLERRALPDM